MSTKTRVCFLICPMGDPKSETRQRSRQLKEKIIEPAIGRLNFVVEDFLDDEGNTESIRQRMAQLIETAELCIADLTESNPNVFFEYGLRRATGRPVLAFIKEGQKLMYDVDDYYTQPYDIEEPARAIEAIEKFAQKIGFGRPTLQLDPSRKDQTRKLCDYIAEQKPRHVDILQFSMLALREDFFPALWRSPQTIVRLLLLHPDTAAKYGDSSLNDVNRAVYLVRSLPENTRRYAPKPVPPCPTVGLWYYRQEPSAAVVIVDDNLLQLGWYFHEFSPGSNQICIKGHFEPGVLAWGDAARTVLTPVREHFRAVLYGAEWASGVGAGSDGLRSEWEQERRQFHEDAHSGGRL